MKHTLFLSTLSAALLLPGIAYAATLTADGTICTLADAIAAADTDTDTDTATGGCPAGDVGADVVVLDADVTLTAIDGRSSEVDNFFAGLPDISSEITIQAGTHSLIQRASSTATSTRIAPSLRANCVAEPSRSKATT